MADELHPAVELLLMRMKTQPEDFVFKPEPHPADNRVSVVTGLYNDALSFASAHEARLLQAANNKIHLDVVHHRLMEELLSGDDRRAAEKGKRDVEANMLAMKQTAMATAQNPQYPQYQQYANMGLLGNPTTGGSPYGAAQRALNDYQQALLGVGGINTTVLNPMNMGKVNMGGEKSDASIIKNVKRKLGL